MSSLVNKLAKLSAIDNSDGLDNPMCSDPAEESIDNDIGFQDDQVLQIIYLPDEGVRGKKKNRLSDIMQRNKVLDTYVGDMMAEALDSYLDDLGEDDVELRDSLIGIGRKYHRDTTASAGTSEISKTYSAAEKNFRNLFTEIAADRQQIQKDIDQMRLARTRNHKALADLVATKKGYYDTQVSILKEINSMHKTAFDLKAKEAAAAKAQEETGSNLSTNTLKSLFSIGRGNMVSALGGYESISGATVEDSDGNATQRDYGDTPEQHDLGIETDSDGDMFLDYEDAGVEYILLVDENDVVQDVLAEDNEGNVIPNYPMPTDYMNLKYNIDKKTMLATDEYHRNYKVRVV